jgi:uncharacterized protein
MFNLGNDDYLQHPVRVNSTVVEAFGDFLAQGAKDLTAETVRIDFHGGEPLMLGLSRFDELCTRLTQKLEGTNVEFGLQTNGTLISDAWIDLFEKHKVGVGVSIDGPAEVHDKFRIDHKNRGTYARTLKGIRRLQKAAAAGRICAPGFLVVVDANQDGGKIYRHLVDDLGANGMNFLLPMVTRDTAEEALANKVGNYLCRVFDEWAKDDKPTINVRILDQAMRFFSGGSGFVNALEGVRNDGYALISVASNGNLNPDDEIKVVNFGQGTANIFSTSLKDYLNSEVMMFLDKVAHSLPRECYECPWQNHCRGGSGHGVTISRYSTTNGFDNASVLCSGLKKFHSRVAAYLLRHGVSEEQLAASLDFEESAYRNSVPPVPKHLLRKEISIHPVASIG